MQMQRTARRLRRFEQRVIMRLTASRVFDLNRLFPAQLMQVELRAARAEAAAHQRSVASLTAEAEALARRSAPQHQVR